MIDLSNKVVLITGCSGGIGTGIAEVLNKAKANIIIHYNQNQAKAKDLLSKLDGNNNHILQADLSDPGQVKELFSEIKNKTGRLDVLVNNAGKIVKDNLSFRFSLNDWKIPVETNLFSVFNCTREAVRLLRKSDQPRIINIASIAASMPFPGQSNYAVSKAAIINFTKTLAVELSSWKILVNTVSPGLIDAGMHENFSAEHKERYLKNIPLQRFGQSEEVGNMVAFLSSSLSSYITGKEFIIDGGLLP
ncbi:MAG: 3-oxoacyl-ACP reductase FabG [bacterium]|nr:3-oxoacyl-ACP reductase FabG [bacterium]